MLEGVTFSELIFRLAGLVMTDPTVLVKIVRYSSELFARVVAAVAYLEPVAPGMLDQDAPRLVLTCHWTIGVGFPDAKAAKIAGTPTETVELPG
jgi:hypothetical protein